MKPRVLVLYEYSVVGLPHSTAYLRLLRPLSYPTLAEKFHVTPAPVYAGQEAELVILDRTWRPDLTLEMAESLVESVRRSGAAFLYHLDDDLRHPAVAWRFTPAQREAVQFFLHEAAAVLVSTPVLAERFAPFNDQILVVPNALDERLLVNRFHCGLPHGRDPFGSRPFVLGYMGTHTHDADLRLILPALQAVSARISVPLELHLIGGVGEAETWRQLRALPFRVRQIEPPTAEYPHFMLWFTGTRHWDLALAPLLDTPFNRGKSDVKFLDYSALGAAGIYSQGTVYESVIHGVDGWLAANEIDVWTEALHTLIGDPRLRLELASAAHRHLVQGRILSHRIHDWIGALETVWYG